MQPLNDETGFIREGVHGTDVSVDASSRSSGLWARNNPLRRLIRGFRVIVPFGSTRMRVLRNGALVAALVFTGSFLLDEDQAVGGALASMSANAGFAVSNLVVNGNNHLHQETIKSELSGLLGKTLFNLDVETAREKLGENRWIKTATVRKVYPDTLVVDLVEREPVALWKSRETLIVISRDGIAIDAAEPKHMHLPQVVGEGANRVASQFLSAMSRFPGLVARADAYVRVAERRWDLVLDDGPKVLLPAENWQDALVALNRMQTEQQILDREIVQIDMRLSDRVVFRLDPDAAEIRRTDMEKALKRDWHKT